MNELEQNIRRLTKNYPIADEALQFYAGIHCPKCRSLVNHKPHGFENGWDSAIRTILNFLKK